MVVSVSKPLDAAVHSKTVQYQIRNLVGDLDRSRINLDPAYQRNAGIWPKDAQSRLIESVFLGFPIPPLYLFQRDLNGVKFDAIDGKQRLSILRDFVKDGFRLGHVEHLPEDIFLGKKFSELPEEVRESFLGRDVDVCRVNPTSGWEKLADREIFQRLNDGVSMSVAERNNGRFNLPIVNEIERYLTRNVLGMTESERNKSNRRLAKSHLACYILLGMEMQCRDGDLYVGNSQFKTGGNDQARAFIESLLTTLEGKSPSDLRILKDKTKTILDMVKFCFEKPGSGYGASGKVSDKSGQGAALLQVYGFAKSKRDLDYWKDKPLAVRDKFIEFCLVEENGKTLTVDRLALLRTSQRWVEMLDSIPDVPDTVSNVSASVAA